MYEITSIYRDDVENNFQRYIFDISAQIREDRKVLSECFLYLSGASRSTGYFLYICNQTDLNPPAALSQATAKGVGSDTCDGQAILLLPSPSSIDCLEPHVRNPPVDNKLISPHCMFMHCAREITCSKSSLFHQHSLQRHVVGMYSGQYPTNNPSLIITVSGMLFSPLYKFEQSS